MEFEFLGPPLEEGPLPGVFYFAFSASDSLRLVPTNLPAKLLAIEGMRVFSLTLPGHHLPPEKALSWWAEQIAVGIDIVEEFSIQAANTIERLHAQNILSSCALMGLSRGAFLSCHTAAKTPLVSHILGFAPLTKLATAKEFAGIDASRFDLEHVSSQLLDRSIRFYIGNRDVRVGTKYAFDLIAALAETAFQRGVRSSPFELIVGPSIGSQGHGTSPEVFRDGANWILRQLRGSL